MKIADVYEYPDFVADSDPDSEDEGFRFEEENESTISLKLFTFLG